MIYGVLLPIDSHRTTHVDVISARSEMSPLVSTLPIDAHHPFIHPSILLPFVSVSRACGCASSARSRVCSFGSSLSSSLVRPPAPAHTTDRSHHVCLYVRTYSTPEWSLVGGSNPGRWIICQPRIRGLISLAGWAAGDPETEAGSLGRT